MGLNNAGAIDTIGTSTSTANGAWLQITGGSLDNTSGAPITTSTYNPEMQWSGSFGFIGSNGANSNLNLGTGNMALTSQATRDHHERCHHPSPSAV